MANLCLKCDGRCCRYFAFEIDKPDTFEEFENIRWFIMHHGVTVHVDQGDWYIAIPVACRNIGPNNLCTIYEDRPLICRTYSNANCDAHAGTYEYEAELKTPEDVEAYARKILGDAKYEAARTRARKLAAKV